ncbi:MAG: hypothetical protein HRU35_02340 [Rickettsiaceae bacterium]|nr:hypothetical protein [Rickettsiaceae bacterium]
MSKKAATKVKAKKTTTKSTNRNKNTYCSTAKVKQASKQQKNNIFGNIFDSDFSDDLKMQSDNFFKSFNSLFCTSMNCSSNNANLSQKLLTKISDNANQLMEHNMQLGKKSLNCQNISDLIELHKTSFEKNYNASIGFYSDIMHLVQNYVSENLQNTTDCVDKNMKCCGLKN